MKEFEFFEHTADIGVRAYGKTLEGLFENNARALFSLLVDVTPYKKIKKSLILDAYSLEELLVNWLNELISLFYASFFLPAEFNMAVETKRELKVLNAEVWGQEFNPYTNKVNMEIKAATYHNLKVEKNTEGFKTEVIFDV